MRVPESCLRIGLRRLAGNEFERCAHVRPPRGVFVVGPSFGGQHAIKKAPRQGFIGDVTFHKYDNSDAPSKPWLIPIAPGDAGVVWWV